MDLYEKKYIYKTEDMKFIRGTEGHNKKAFRRNEI